MAALFSAFDANTVDPAGTFEALPTGDYQVMIIDSAMEPTKLGNGHFLKLTLQVIDGPHKDATLFDRLNLDNPNPKAVEIAQRTLSAICHAIGVLQVQDSAQLHNRPLNARVIYKPAANGYDAGNDIKGYKPLGPVSAAAAVPAAAPAAAPAWQQPAPVAAAPAAPAAAAPPWGGQAAAA